MLPSMQGQGRPPQGMPSGQAPQGMPPQGMPGQGQGGAGQDQGQVIEAIKQVLQRVKSMADQYGIDLASIMAEMDQGKSVGMSPAGKPPMPPPPSAPPM